MIHILTSIKIVQFSRPPTLLSIMSKILHPLELGNPISNEPSPPSPYPNDNQSTKRKHNLRMTVICYQVRPSGWLSFSVSIINLVWLFFDFFSFRWSLTIFFFVALYSCACSCPKISQNFFVCNYSHFWYSFCNQPVLFARLENVSKPWNNSRTVQVKERNQNKSKTKSRHIQIDEGFYCSI